MHCLLSRIGCIAGDVVRTELRLAVSYQGWEYTVLKKDSSHSTSSRGGQEIQVMVGVDVLVLFTAYLVQVAWCAVAPTLVADTGCVRVQWWQTQAVCVWRAVQQD
jgi:hypothetical protein